MATPRWITAAEVTDEEAGDVQGPDSAVDGNIALFDGTTGKLLKAAGVVEGVATIDSTTNILIGDGAGNAVDSGKPLGGDVPVTLNPGDIVLQDAEGELLEYSGDAIYYVTPLREGRAGYFAVNSTDGTNMLNIHDSGSIELLALDGNDINPAGNIQVTSGFGFNDGDDTPANGGDVLIQLGSGVNGGRNGVVDISNVLMLRPTDEPSVAEEGMIYSGHDHHLYYYNGTTWKQLDNT